MQSVHSFQSSSRDPAGVDPSGMDVIHGADPPLDDESDDLMAILPPKLPAGPPPPTPRRDHHPGYNHGVHAPSPVMAFLVGSPPPPPPTPPPRRSPRAKRAEGFAEPPGSVTPVSIGENAFRHYQQQQQYRQQQVEYYHQETKVVGNIDIVENRGREPTNGRYDTDKYYTVHQSAQYGEHNETNKELASPPIMTNTELVDRENEPPNNFADMASPRSAVTEPHSNKGVKPRKSRDSGNNENMSNAKSGNRNAAKPKQGKKTKGEKNPDKAQATPQGGQKMGFIKKLFRGGKKKDAERLLDDYDDDDEITGFSTLQETTVHKSCYTEILPPPQGFLEEEMVAPYAQVTFHGALVSSMNDNCSQCSALSQSLAVETKSKQGKAIRFAEPTPIMNDKEVAGLETSTSNLTNDMDPDHQEMFFAHDEVSALTLPTINSHSRKSVDPEDAYTVQTGISSEPMGKYWNDREKPDSKPKATSPNPGSFAAASFKEPDGESPIVSKQKQRRNKAKLQVQVPSSKDPVGETPPHKGSTVNVQEPSPRGWESPIVELKDPQGSTPSEAKQQLPKLRGLLPSPFKKGTPPLPSHEMRREPSAYRDGSPYALDPSPVKHFGEEGEENMKTGTPKQRLPPVGRGSAGKRVAVEPPSPSILMALKATQPPTPTIRPEKASKKLTPASDSEVVPQPPPSNGKNQESKRKSNLSGEVTLPVQRRQESEPAADINFLDELFQEGPAGNKPVAAKESSNITSQRKRDNVDYREEKKEEAFGESSIERAILAQNMLGKKMLATSTAALGTAASMNAKTVAYLHSLNGDLSPRHAWRRTELSDDEYSPVKSEVQKKAISNIKAVMLKKSHTKASRTDEDAFHDFVCADAPTRAVSTSSNARFQAPKIYSVVNCVVNLDSSNRQSNMTKSLEMVPVSSPPSMDNNNVLAEGAALSFGLDLIRLKRYYDIMSGRVGPVQPIKPQPKQTVSQEPQFVTEEDVKDPIQRAGLRLLAKSAVPIQSIARRYLAQLDFMKRIQALVIIQSYFRRWECEAILRSYVHVSFKIQATFRSWLVRKDVANQHYHASQIQKIFRGHRAQAHVRTILFWVTRMQAQMRGWLGRIRHQKFLQLRDRKATMLQSWVRGYKDRREARVLTNAAVVIQAMYKAYAAKIKYQLVIADVLTAQSAVRQFLAKKVVKEMQLQKMNVAACKIQAAWRGFQGYTDYIFSLVDILVLQRTMRKWLAMKKLDELRKNQAAIKIQTQWRRQTALIGMLYDLVHIIIVQSVARRFLVKLKLPQLRDEKVERDMEQMRLDMAATNLQAAWRGFWGYSHFIIVQYELVRLQAIVRGKIARSRFSLKLGCCIMIQSVARRYLANQRALELKRAKAFVDADIQGMRSKTASRRIQFWWRVVLECNREKKAALVIERFFLMVKAEVDREIKRQHALKVKNSSQRRQERKTLIKKQLGSEWVKSTDRENIFASGSNDDGSQSYGRSRSAPRLRPNDSYMSDSSSETSSPRNGPLRTKHHHSASDSNKMAHIMRQAYELKNRRDNELRHRLYRGQGQDDEAKPPSDVTLTGSEDKSEVSAITTPTIFNRRKRSKLHKTKRDHDDSLSLDKGALMDADVDKDYREASPGKASDVLSSAMHSVPNKYSKKKHFFGEESSQSASKKSGLPPKARRHHSTSSLASELSNGIHAHTATTASASSSRSNSDSRGWNRNLPSPQVDKKYGADKYNASQSSPVNRPSTKESPRYEKIMVTKSSADYLEAESLDNVEVQYIGETEYGVI